MKKIKGSGIRRQNLPQKMTSSCKFFSKVLAYILMAVYVTRVPWQRSEGAQRSLKLYKVQVCGMASVRNSAVKVKQEEGQDCRE